MSSAATPREGAVPGDGRVRRGPPHSALFWGDDRRLVNQLLFHAAEAVDPQFTWVEIAQLGDDPRPGEPSVSGRIPSRRLLVVRPEQLRPRSGADVAPLVPSDSTRATVPPREAGRPDLGLFRDLPAFVPPMLTGIFPSAGPRVLAVANGDRMEEYYPAAGKLAGRLIGLIGALGVSLFVGFCGVERPEFGLYDSVLRLQGAGGGMPPQLSLYRGEEMPGWPGPEPWALDRLAGFSDRQRELFRPPDRGP